MDGSAETQGREGPDLADAAMKERAEVQHWSAYLNQTCMQRVQQGTELAESDRTKESETQTGKTVSKLMTRLRRSGHLWQLYSRRSFAGTHHGEESSERKVE